MNSTRPDRQELVTFSQEFIPDIADCAPIETLRGGSLNFVWRIQNTAGKSFIIKHAPPYVASMPDIELDNSRILFEATILKAFQFRNELLQLAGFAVRPPEFLAKDPRKHLLLMEDVGSQPDLLQAVGLSDDNLAAYGADLGAYTAQLHVQTYQSRWFAENFANLPVQQTRLQVQYNGCLEFCRRARLPEAEKVGKLCRRLGEKFNSVGKCLIMGDLWPGSILLDRNEVRLIDWELTHFGRPAQDVAHLAAHLWMISHRASKQSHKNRIDGFRQSFLASYLDGVTSQRPELISAEDERDFQIHFGAEILARTLGSFQKNYLYDGLSPQHPIIQEAGEEACKWICGAYDAFKP